ncbi:Gfo/Idh/MocA family protein [Schumannella sp. 10F1B-5-1]|uniref:Gfo/Idh/MocA family protein n=1 Tax=Schumannella sp. 10F1B-5-1 TaxID=2590780 RepID=UPI0011320A6C|nr:Gfo/Idh/MocA family oxidoreductase [Schumannella sp. 10F1B-5-1]TPW70688.1 Gfo/Idh/MocA family oxidoreductase [Schumannella sp. 10F1B-5-1]
MSAPRIALVGAGSMGRNHARVISANPDSDFSVIVDPFEEVGRATADLHQTSWVADLDGIGDVDGVVVAASTEYHYDIVKELIGRGLPILVEKPVCPSLEQTKELIALAEKSSVPIMCGFLERYNPAIIQARRMMGEPLYIRAERHSPYVPRIKTGVAWDLLVHDVDLISHMYGSVPPANVNVEVGQFHPSSLPGAEDVIDVSLRFGRGGLASASASRIGQRKVRSMVVQSLDTMIEVDLLRRGVTLYRHTHITDPDDAGAGYRQSTEMEVPEISGDEPLAAQFKRFLGLIDGTADVDAERLAILPAHEIVERALAVSRESAADESESAPS